MKSRTLFVLPLVAFCVIESACGFLPVRAQASELQLDAYTTRISDQLLNAWQNSSVKENKKSTSPTDILVTIDGGGAVTDIKVEKSSGDNAKDLSVINSIRKFAKVEAPPDKESIQLSITFVIDSETARILQNNTGVKALQTNDFDKAIAKLTEVWKKYPADVLARQNLATAYNNRALTEVKQKKLTAAKNDLERAYDIDPRMLTLTNIETLHRQNHDLKTLNFLLAKLKTPLIAKLGSAEELFELYAKVAIDCQSAQLNKECLDVGLLALHLDRQNKQVNGKELI